MKASIYPKKTGSRQKTKKKIHNNPFFGMMNVRKNVETIINQLRENRYNIF